MSSSVLLTQVSPSSTGSTNEITASGNNITTRQSETAPGASSSSVKQATTPMIFKDKQSVTKRLQSELMQLMFSSPPGISAFPESDTNLLKWAGTIEGPTETPYQGLKFKLSLEFGSDYPYTAPKVKFVSPMWHPNVDMSGNICLDILKDKWSAIYNVQSILLSLQSLLGEPNNKSPLNAQAAQLWDTDMEEYKRLLMQRYEEIED